MVADMDISQTLADNVDAWPALSLDTDDDAILTILEQSAPVRLIATLGEFTAAYADEAAVTADQRALAGRFDFLPVRDGYGGPIIGLFRCSTTRTSSASSVRDAMAPLSSENLISADAPLLDFVVSADRWPCRLLLDRSEIRGLVTLSDLQRLPVRTMLFGLFIHLELLLTDELKRLIGSNVCPFAWLAARDASGARKRWKKSVKDGLDRDLYAALMFSDKISLAQQRQVLGKPPDIVGQELIQIQNLIRHPIAHGRSYALTSDDTNSVVITTRTMISWISALRDRHRMHRTTMRSFNGSPAQPICDPS
jgi:hypothetical protein